MNINLFKQVVTGSVLNAQTLVIRRSVGRFIAGRWTASDPEEISILGNCQPSSNKELMMLPEGDRVKGGITFYTTVEIFVTHNITSSPEDRGISDKIVWQGEEYKVLWVNPWRDYGYWMSIGLRIVGD